MLIRSQPGYLFHSNASESKGSETLYLSDSILSCHSQIAGTFTGMASPLLIVILHHQVVLCSTGYILRGWECANVHFIAF